jgi:hypothetical protein
MLIAMIIAVRQALDYRSTVRSIAVVFIGWILNVVVFGILYWIFRKPDSGEAINAVFGIAAAFPV